MPFCTNCGEQLADDAAFCKKCGQKVGAVNANPPESPARNSESPVNVNNCYQQTSASSSSASVSAIATVTLIGGLIGLSWSFMPCLGIFALFVSIPSAIIGVIGMLIARLQKSSMGYITGATTVAILGAIIAYLQYAALSGMGKH
jgi:hypothetical protein